MIHFYANDPSAVGVELLQVSPTPGLLSDFPIRHPTNVKPQYYEPGTIHFQFWQATESLRRGKALWTLAAGPFQWYTGKSLPINLRAGRDFNAYYDRRGLKFFYEKDPSGDNEVFTCESPDIVCHEQGHAFLDVLRPDLWDSTFLEAAALHEAFGDCAAILISLQELTIRKAMLSQAGSNFRRSNLISRLAEELGMAIRYQEGRGSKRDPFLRDAVHSLVYVPPEMLPEDGPDSRLTAEPHNFSRIFTGAIYQTLIYALVKSLASSSSAAKNFIEQLLIDLSQELAKLLVVGIQEARLEPRLFRSVAEAMLEKAVLPDVRPVWRSAILYAFRKTRILGNVKPSSTKTSEAKPKTSLRKKGMIPKNLREANRPSFLHQAKRFLGMSQVCDLKFTCMKGLCLLGFQCKPLVLKGSRYGILRDVEIPVHVPVQVHLDPQGKKTFAHSKSSLSVQRENETHARAFAQQLLRAQKIYPIPVDRKPKEYHAHFAGYTHAVIREGSTRRLERLAFALGAVKK